MRKLLILAAFQVLVILSWASYHEYVWGHLRRPSGFRFDPATPSIWSEGDTSLLNPLDSILDWRSLRFPRADVERLVGSSGAFDGVVQVGFCPVDDLYRVCALARPGEKASVPAAFWCRGYATVNNREGHWKVNLDMGLHRFFIPYRPRRTGTRAPEGWQVRSAVDGAVGDRDGRVRGRRAIG